MVCVKLDETFTTGECKTKKLDCSAFAMGYAGQLSKG